MSLIRDTISVFERGSKRILWLPVLAVGYTYTLTGVWWEFGLAVAAIGGARIFSDMVDALESGLEDVDMDGVIEYREEDSPLKIWYLAVIVVLYAVAAIYSMWRLYDLFDHTDIILVALSLSYCGVAVIVAINVKWRLPFRS